MENGKKYSILRKIPGYRTTTPWKMVIASIFYTLFIIACVDVISEGPAPQNTKTQPAISQKENKAAKDWPNAEITEETVNKALAGKTDVKPSSMSVDFPDSITEITLVGLGGSTKNVWVYYSMGSVWDETDLVKKAGGTALFASNILYQNPNVEEVALFAQGEFTDHYGKTNLNTAVKIVVSKSLADQVDWKGLADLHVTDPGNIYRIVDSYAIHPGILSEVKTSEIEL